MPLSPPTNNCRFSGKSAMVKQLPLTASPRIFVTTVDMPPLRTSPTTPILLFPNNATKSPWEKEQCRMGSEKARMENNSRSSGSRFRSHTAIMLSLPMDIRTDEVMASSCRRSDSYDLHVAFIIPVRWSNTEITPENKNTG